MTCLHVYVPSYNTLAPLIYLVYHAEEALMGSLMESLARGLSNSISLTMSHVYGLLENMKLMIIFDTMYIRGH